MRSHLKAVAVVATTIALAGFSGSGHEYSGGFLQSGNQQPTEGGGQRQPSPLANAETFSDAYQFLVDTGNGYVSSTAISVFCTPGDVPSGCVSGSASGVHLDDAVIPAFERIGKSLNNSSSPGYAGLTGDFSDTNAFGGWGDWHAFATTLKSIDGTIDAASGFAAQYTQDLPRAGTATYKGAAVAAYLFKSDTAAGSRGYAWSNATIHAYFGNETIDIRLHNSSQSHFPDIHFRRGFEPEFFGRSGESSVHFVFAGPDAQEIVGFFTHVVEAGPHVDFPQAAAAIVGAFGAKRQ